MDQKTTTTNIAITQQILSSNHDLRTTNSLPITTSISKSYYRSRTFVADIGTNPLIASAAPLISLCNRLQCISDYKNITDLYKHLIHEVKAFEANAKKRDYRTETIVVARYILCCAIDETIMNTEWGKGGGWHRQQLLSAFQRETNADERFFVILDRLLHDAKEHLDLLELIYLVLSLGYEGKYRHQHRGDTHLGIIKDNLYQCIIRLRPEPTPLFTDKHEFKPSIQEMVKHFSFWKVLLICLFIAITLYVSLDFMVDQHQQVLEQEIMQFNQLLGYY